MLVDSLRSNSPLAEGDRQSFAVEGGKLLAPAVRDRPALDGQSRQEAGLVVVGTVPFGSHFW